MANVVGIFPDSGSARTAVDSLKSAGCDPECIRILTSDQNATELATTGAQYTWLGDVRPRGASGGMITGFGNISVPGLGGRGLPPSVEGSTLDESLAELSVPDARTDDYAIALERGRTVIGVRATAEEHDKLRGLLSSAGAAKVDVFGR